VVFYEYSLVYGLDGRVDETNPYAADWIRVAGEAMFAPLNVLELAESRWAGHNPHVTEANVRSLDQANGGGAMARLRRSSPPPLARPSRGTPRLRLGAWPAARRWSPAAWVSRSLRPASAAAGSSAASSGGDPGRSLRSLQ